MKERGEHGGDVATGGEIGLGHAIDEALWRIVADKANGQLAREELRRGGASGEQVQQLAAFQFAVLLELLAQHFLGAGLMALGRR